MRKSRLRAEFSSGRDVSAETSGVQLRRIGTCNLLVDLNKPFRGDEGVAVAHGPKAFAGVPQGGAQVRKAVELSSGRLPELVSDWYEVVPVYGRGAGRNDSGCAVPLYLPHTVLLDFNPPRHLPIALPIGALLRDPRVFSSGLDISALIGCPRRD